MTARAKSVRRQIFVFTPEEKRAAACVLFAFLLGLATKHYRETHPRAAPQLTAREQYQAQRAAKAAKAYARSARGQRATTTRAPAPPPTEQEDDED